MSWTERLTPCATSNTNKSWLNNFLRECPAYLTLIITDVFKELSCYCLYICLKKQFIFELLFSSKVRQKVMKIFTNEGKWRRGNNTLDLLLSTSVIQYWKTNRDTYLLWLCSIFHSNFIFQTKKNIDIYLQKPTQIGCVLSYLISNTLAVAGK